MGEIYFVRHGQASFGSDDYDRLSPLGHQQAQWLGAHLADTVPKFDTVLCGTLRRHKETLAGLQKFFPHADVTFDARLNEISYGVMEDEYCATAGLEKPTTSAALAALFTNVMQDWKNGNISAAAETFADFQNRTVAVVKDAAVKDQRVLIVSSGGPIGMTMRVVLGLDIHALIEVILLTHNASYSRFRLIDGRLHLSQFNAIPHLESTDRAHAQTYL